MNIQDYKLLAKPKGKGRFPRVDKSRRTVDGIIFDSMAEAHRYVALRMRERLGEIHDLRRQVSYPVEIKGLPFCKFKPDFEYVLTSGLQVIEEVKSTGTAKEPDYKLRKLAFELYYGLKVTEIISR